MTLRAGLVGAGMMGRHHARVLSSLPGVTLVGIADPAPVARLDGVPIVPHLADLLRLGIDYAVLATPSPTHAALAAPLAAARIPTLIEKPLALCATDADEITARYSAMNTFAAVGHIERFHPAIQAAAVQIQDGQIGTIQHITTVRLGPPPGRPMGTGVTLDLATHDIDTTMHLTGRRYAHGAVQYVTTPDGDHEDQLVVTATLDDDTTITHIVSRCHPTKVRSTTIIGDRGVITADTLTPTDIEPLRLEHEAFRDAILTGDTSKVATLTQARDVVAVAEAMLNGGSFT